MSRNALPKQLYQVVSQSRGVSKSPRSIDQPMTTIRFCGVSDNKQYVTYIVDNFKNIKQWQTILDNPYAKQFVQLDPGWLSYGNTIDADSKPYLVTKPQTNSTADRRYKIPAVDVSDIFTSSVSLVGFSKQITKDFYAKLDNSVEYAEPANIASNTNLIFAIACQQNNQLRNLLAKSLNVEIYLVDTVNNSLNDTDDETWFGHAVFDVNEEDYMLHQLGQTE